MALQCYLIHTLKYSVAIFFCTDSHTVMHFYHDLPGSCWLTLVSYLVSGDKNFNILCEVLSCRFALCTDLMFTADFVFFIIADCKPYMYLANYCNNYYNMNCWSTFITAKRLTTLLSSSPPPSILCSSITLEIQLRSLVVL